MIFEPILREAESKSEQFKRRIRGLRAAKKQAAYELIQCDKHLALFEQRLKEAREQRAPYFELEGYVLQHYKRARRYYGFGYNAHFHLRQPRQLAKFRQAAELRKNYLSGLIVELERRLDLLLEQRYQLDFWILEKRESWGRISKETLEEQIAEIYQCCLESSRFLLNHEVDLSFDFRDNAPLGHVNLSKQRRNKRGKKSIVLSAELLEKQTPFLRDCYKALIVHELGHHLLHLGGSKSEYQRFRKLLQKRFSLAPGFFSILNIIMDEQLERLLRDTKKDWQRAFLKLDFYARQIPLSDLKKLWGKEDLNANSLIDELAREGALKVYENGSKPFVSLLSADLFARPELGFSRLFGFERTLRTRLPRKTVTAPWLKEALALIPKNFLKLNPFELYRLAAQLYEILIPEGQREPAMKVRLQSSQGLVELEIPGRWREGLESSESVLVIHSRKKSRESRRTGRGSGGGGSRLMAQKRSQQSLSSAPPECPPEPPQSHTKTVLKRQASPGRTKFRPGRHRVSRVSEGRGTLSGQELLALWAGKNGSRGGGAGRGGGRSKQTLSARAKLSARMKRGHLSQKEKTRLLKEVKKEEDAARRRKEQEEQNKARQKALSKAQSKAPRPESAAPRDRALEIERQLKQTDPKWSAKSAQRSVQKALNQLLRDVKSRLSQGQKVSPKQPKDKSQGAPQDVKNRSEERHYPALETRIPLPFQRGAMLRAQRRVSRFVPALLPFLRAIEDEKSEEERLYSGKRVQSSRLLRHLSYGELKLFKDQRFQPRDNHMERALVFLLDVSASMQKERRLERAQDWLLLLCECLKSCEGIETRIFAFNQSLYDCGHHEAPALSSLSAGGQTNEAAALEAACQFLKASQRKVKRIVTFSDGLPTACSARAVQSQVRRSEREENAPCLFAAFSAEPHPAYTRRIQLNSELGMARVLAFGRQLQSFLRS